MSLVVPCPDCGAPRETVASGYTWAWVPGHVCGAAPKPKPRQKRAQGVERPFRPRAGVGRTWLKLWLPRPFRAAEGPNGRAWKAKNRAGQEWRELVAAALATLERKPRWERISVLYVAYGRREMDRDNIVALGKPILDALVRNEVVPDDSAAHVPAPPDARWRECPLWPGGEFVVVEVRAVRPAKEG